jgi:coenzyme F420-reducing hydrogenase alpha subunit
MLNKFILITLFSTLILGGCGNKLNKKTAKKVLTEAQEPVDHPQTMMSALHKSQVEDKKGFLDIYSKAKLVTSVKEKIDQKDWYSIEFNDKRIAKKWANWVAIEVKPENAGGTRAIIQNYTTRVGEILRVNTKPVDHLCDALVEYKYESYNYAPWGKDIAALKTAGKTVYEACFIKYDKDWGVKDWRKKPARKRR